eukprot:1683739-Ditylum_brightwellii.AAC.1
MGQTYTEAPVLPKDLVASRNDDHLTKANNWKMDNDDWNMDDWNMDDDDWKTDDWKTDDWKIDDWDLVDDWHPKNDWKGGHKHKHNKKRLAFELDGCMYNFTNTTTTDANLVTFPPSGTTFSPRDFISAS